MNPKFTPSKTVRDVIQFDKEHKQLRFLMDEEKVIPYRENQQLFIEKSVLQEKLGISACQSVYNQWDPGK